jgi:hypothetical protein
MNVEAVRERFAELARSEHRSQMARLREVFENVETALAAGVTVSRARDELALLGLDIKLPTFQSMLHRLRAERAAQSVPPESPGVSSVIA